MKWVPNADPLTGGSTAFIDESKISRFYYEPKSKNVANNPSYGGCINGKIFPLLNHDLLTKAAQEYAEDMAMTGQCDHNAISRKGGGVTEAINVRAKRAGFYAAPDLKDYRYKFRYAYDFKFDPKLGAPAKINEKFMKATPITTEISDFTQNDGKGQLSESVGGWTIPLDDNYIEKELSFAGKTEDQIDAAWAKFAVDNWAASTKGHRENQFSAYNIIAGVGVAIGKSQTGDSNPFIYICLKVY